MARHQPFRDSRSAIRGREPRTLNTDRWATQSRPLLLKHLGLQSRKLMNKVILSGRLGADPEVRTANSGTMVAKLRMATNGRQKNADGNWETSTDWHNVVAFGKTAELVDNYAPKGKELVVEGKLKTNHYEDRDGNKRYATEVIADNIELVGARVEKTNNETHSNNGGGVDLPF